MNDHLPSDQLSDDVSWVRQQLGAANPVPFPGRVTVPRPGPAAPAFGTDASEGARRLDVPPPSVFRRAKVATAVVGAAAMIGAIVAAGVISAGGSDRGVTRLASTQPVMAAAATTEAARTAQVSLSVTVGATLTNVQGVADLSTGNAQFTADLPAGIGAAEVRIIGPVAYVELPASVQGLLGGKPWIKADVPTVEALAGQQLGLPGFASGLDFTGVLDWLRGVSGPVTTDGTATIRGEMTTHYHADVDLTKAAANAPSASRSKLEQAAQAAGQTVPVDVWIDSQGRLRRLKASFDPTRVEAPREVTSKSPGTVVATLDLWNFGTQVNVSPPPADQLSPLTGAADVFKGLVGRQGGPVDKGSATTNTTLAG
jgi:hypothetical protein